MLISRVEDDKSEGRQASDSHEYQTANELFDLMARDHPFEHASETLSTQDLVILYENIDLGTKLMSNSEGYNLNRKPNQRVENVVYNDDQDSDSETSEIYNTEDLYNVFSINKERIDMLSSQPSYQNTLCQKLGDLEIQASNLSLQYNQHFLFKDPYIKEQLKNFDGDLNGSALPASLLDYICCRRLEDNYNFYMDNIIRYVKHTIDQLKRISNGDYLTDKAKEKWREVEDAKEDDTKVLATSTSIPLQVERKLNGVSTTWDDIIHSEVDIRSLSKILEKRIIVEVPKLICGSYKLFSKLCSENLVISCKREPQASSERDEARVDVVLQLSRSETGQVMSNISSIMILQPTPPVLPVECPKVLPLPYKENEEETVSKKKVTIVEIPEVKEENNEESLEEVYSDVAGEEIDDNVSVLEYMDEDVNFLSESKTNNSNFESGDSSAGLVLKNSSEVRGSESLGKETSCSFFSSDEYSISMHKLNMGSLPEESSEDMPVNPVSKKRSPTKVRVKSPYENKSYMIEEKKRKKLLEIREKREKRKMAIGESCKITKHKYGKGPTMPQPVSSVTKLSITNKSFYNSIYGHNIMVDKQSSKSKGYRGRRESVLDMPLDQSEEDLDSPLLTPEKNNKKYVNRSYYLDEAVTEMMYTDNKHSDCSSVRDLFSGSTSAMSGDFTANINIINQIMNSPPSDMDRRLNSPNGKTNCLDERKDFSDLNEDDLEDNHINVVVSSKSLLDVPSNSPKDGENDIDDSKKALQTVECRKSIDKLYELMKKIQRIDSLELKSSRSKLLPLHKVDSKAAQDSSLVQGSDSGTSLKHHLTSSNPSSFSFDKTNSPEENIAMKSTNNKKTVAPTTVVPKVIISTKQQTEKVDVERPRKERKKVVVNPPAKDSDNPLKAISHLLHEFDSVQKTRHKTPTELKPNKRPEIPVESRNMTRQGPIRRRSRVDQPVKEGIKEMKEQDTHDCKNVKVFITKERRPRPIPPTEMLKIPHQQISEEKHTDRSVTRKKIADIIDEVREAKGEAVRGPSRPSRLNALAQPKKCYVQAHSEEYQTKYGRTLMADRLQRLAAAARARPRRADAGSAVSLRSPVQPTERAPRPRRSAGSSPEAKPDVPSKQGPPTDAPDTLKNKMVAVESYLKSHYGRSSPTTPSELKARVPLVPNDLDLSSVPSSPGNEDPSAIGSKLHYMINSMMSPKPPPLAALPEAQEPSARPSRDDVRAAASSVDSDYPADIFEDKNVKTAVETFQDKPEEIADDQSKNSSTKYEESCSSSVELQRLQDAFHGRLVPGTFHKRLRIKNLTLTPKPPQQVLVLESGDAGSIVLKSTVSKSLKMSASRSGEDIQTLSNLCNSRLDWNISNIPMQVATVGYAFPEYNTALCKKKLAIKSLDNILKLGITSSSTSTKIKRSHKTSQCSKGTPESQSKQDKREAVGATEKNTEVAVFKKNQLSPASVATDVDLAVEKPCGARTSITDVQRTLKEVEHIKDTQDSVDCTSSLDMLVGILNEIQKITTCHMTKYSEICADEHECKEVETMLTKEAAALSVKISDSHELVSIASLDKLRQLESSPSIYSLYLSNDERDSINSLGVSRLKTSMNSVLCNSKPHSADKEVSADFPVRELTNTFTEVPSKFFPITITHSTNVSSSLIGLKSKPSSQTVISLHDYTAFDSFGCDQNILEVSPSNAQKGMLMIEYPANGKSENPVKIIKDVSERMKSIEGRITTENNVFSKQTKCCVNSSDLDPTIKLKRDILVTVYSMLVLTVFAALSFPDLLYHV